MDETNEQYIDLRFTSEGRHGFDFATPFRVQDEALGTRRSNQGRDRSSQSLGPIKVETDCHPIHNSPPVQRVFLAPLVDVSPVADSTDSGKPKQRRPQSDVPVRVSELPECLKLISIGSVEFQRDRSK